MSICESTPQCKSLHFNLACAGQKTAQWKTVSDSLNKWESTLFVHLIRALFFFFKADNKDVYKSPKVADVSLSLLLCVSDPLIGHMEMVTEIVVPTVCTLCILLGAVFLMFLLQRRFWDTRRFPPFWHDQTSVALEKWIRSIWEWVRIRNTYMVIGIDRYGMSWCSLLNKLWRLQVGYQNSLHLILKWEHGGSLDWFYLQWMETTAFKTSYLFAPRSQPITP